MRLTALALVTTLPIAASLLTGPPLPKQRKPTGTRVRTTAYDCAHPEALTKAIDLREPGGCQNPIKDFDDPIDVEAAVVRENVAVGHPVFHCAVKVTRYVTWCGTWSLTFGTTTTMQDSPHFLNRQECERAVVKRELNFEGTTFMLHDATSEWMEINHFTHGAVKPDGTCEVESFVSNGKRYEGAYERVHLKVLARRVEGQWEPDSGAIEVDRQLLGTFRLGELLDSFAGAYYWASEGHTAQTACALRTDRIYRGMGKLYRQNKSGLHGDASLSAVSAGSLLMVTPRDNSQGIAVVLGHTERHCGGAQCYEASNLSGFAVCFLTGKEAGELATKPAPWFTWMKLDNRTDGKPDLVLRNAVDKAEWDRAISWSHTDFLHLSHNLRLHSTIEGLVREQCRLE